MLHNRHNKIKYTALANPEGRLYSVNNTSIVCKGRFPQILFANTIRSCILTIMTSNVETATKTYSISSSNSLILQQTKTQSEKPNRNTLEIHQHKQMQWTTSSATDGWRPWQAYGYKQPWEVPTPLASTPRF